MKLIRCNIENFGILHQYALNFEEGMTTICQSNGTGKSTLTMFLQTMFYGFPRGHKNLDKDLRRKYKPWQGGEYGGFVVFEVDGETYRLERYFGDRPSADTFTLYTLDPLKPSDRFDKDIGIALFGLDEESYGRTSFIPQQMLGADLNAAGITMGLTTLVENTEDVHRYDHAMEQLRQKRSELLLYRGYGGKIAQTTERISQLQDSCYRLEQARQELPIRLKECADLEIQLVDLKEEQEQLQELITRTNEGIWMKQLHEQYKHMQLESERLSLAIQAMNLSYPRGFPAPEAVEDAMDTLKDLDPAILVQDQDQLMRLKHQVELTKQHYEQEQPDEASYTNMQETFQTMMDYYDQLEENDTQIQHDHDAYEKLESSQRRLGLYLGAATLSLLIALVWFLFQKIVPGIAFLVVGLGFMLTVYLSNQKKDLDRNEEEILLDAQGEIRKKVQTLEQELSNELLRFFPVTSSGEYPFQLQQIASDLKTISEGEKQILCLEEKIQVQKERIQSAKNKLTLFCQQYSLPTSLLSYKGLMQMKEDHIRFQSLQEDYRNTNDELSAFLLDNGPVVTQDVTVNPKELPVLKERFRLQSLELAHIQNQLAEETQVIKQLKSKADQLPGILDQISALKETKATYEKEVRHLDLAMKHLKEARESLTESYLQQIKDAWIRYCNRILPEGLEKEACFIGPDLTMTLDRMGQARELNAFSTGTADLLRFCMRLALVDALYPKHKPILILDDPFVNLDAEHGQKAMELLKSMEDQQILYLTCHESRT